MASIALPRAAPLPAALAKWLSLRSVLVFLAAAILTLVSLDQVVLRAPFLTANLPLPDYPRGKLLLSHRYADSEVLYLGDSRALMGIDPAAVTSECECGPGFNAAFSAGEPISGRLLTRQLMDVLSPRVAVITLSHWHLSDKATIQEPAWGDLVPFWELRRYDRGAGRLDDVRSAVGGYWQLYRYRAEIRTLLDPQERGQPSFRRGFMALPNSTRGADPAPNLVREAALFQPDLNSRRTAALTGWIGDLQAHHARVVLLLFPMAPALYSEVEASIAPFRQTMSQLAGQAGVELLDLTLDPMLANDDFWDPIHLNERGAETFSRQLGALLRSHR